jgi:hypothetical protein
MLPDYLTDEAMTALMEKIKMLRKGQPLHPGAKAPYLAVVDNEYHWFKTIPSLRKFLEKCFFPPAYRVFRNFDKGVTVDLDV